MQENCSTGCEKSCNDFCRQVPGFPAVGKMIAGCCQDHGYCSVPVNQVLSLILYRRW